MRSIICELISIGYCKSITEKHWLKVQVIDFYVFYLKFQMLHVAVWTDLDW